MDSRVRQQVSRAGEPAEPGWLPPLTELALALPVRMARGVAVLLRPDSSQPGRDGIDVPPMSSEWLQQIAIESDKRGYLP